MDTKVKQLTTQQLIDQGVALQAAGAIDTARDIFERVLEREPHNAAAHYSLGAIESITCRP
jgi:Flp pilus assembly protein TadD